MKACSAACLPDPSLTVFPAHEYKGRAHSTIGQELADNPRLQKRDRDAFIEMMQQLNLSMPTHITEALRTNMTGGKTVAQMLSEAAATVPFMSLDELHARIESGTHDLIVLDVREREAFEGISPSAPASRAIGAARESRAARSDPQDTGVLRIRPRRDAGDRHVAHDGIPGCGGARWRDQGMAGSGLRGEGGKRTLSVDCQCVRLCGCFLSRTLVCSSAESG
jgi:hypothetical protein